MSTNARVALLLVALGLTVAAIALDVAGVAVRDWWEMALPGLVALILVFLLIREVKVR